MNPLTVHTRKKRVLTMHSVLCSLFPKSQIHLNYETPFELLVAVILSAQCTDARVNTITATLFKKYSSIEAYADVPRAQFEKDIFACGFYRTKARHIQAAARQILERESGRVPYDFDALIKLPGVGRKTANVILSELTNIDYGIAVDTHVRRFSIRFDLSDHRDPQRIEEDLMLVVPQALWWEFTHRLIEYGRKYCPARPHDCSKHPLTHIYPQAEHVWPKARS